jgi:hypothetical protein
MHFYFLHFDTTFSYAWLCKVQKEIFVSKYFWQMREPDGKHMCFAYLPTTSRSLFGVFLWKLDKKAYKHMNFNSFSLSDAFVISKQSLSPSPTVLPAEDSFFSVINHTKRLSQFFILYTAKKDRVIRRLAKCEKNILAPIISRNEKGE